MKKKIVLLLLSTMLTLSACGSATTSTDTQQPDAVSDVSKEETITEEPQDETADTTIPEDTKVTDNTNATATVAEQTLLEQDGLKITVTGIETDMMGTDLKVLIENESSTNVTVQARTVSVNGYMMDPVFSADVVSGKKANESITFMKSDFENCEIDQIANVSLSFHIFNTESWDTIYDSDIIEINTSVFDSYTQTYNDSGEVLYENNGVKIVSQGFSDDSFFGPSLKLYIENNSEKNITVQSRDTSINGFMVDCILSSEVAPGKKRISSMTFMSSDLEANGITDITDIETSFHIYITETMDTLEDTAAITITF